MKNRPFAMLFVDTEMARPRSVGCFATYTSPSHALLSDAWDGLVYVAKHPTLRGLAISVSTNNIANGLFFIGLPVLVLTRLGGGPAQVGQLFALSGITAAISVLFFGRFGTEGRERPLMAGSMLVIGL